MDSLKKAAKILKELALLGEVLGENPFSLKSYRRAGEALEQMLTKGEGEDWRALPGVGKKIRALVEEVLETGRSSLYEEWRSKLPEEVELFLKIPGLGPKKLKKILERYSPKTLEDLESLTLSGKLRELPGFGKGIEKSIREGLEFVRRIRGKALFWQAREEAETWLKRLREKGVCGELTGEVRRGAELVSAVELLVVEEEGVEQKLQELGGKREEGGFSFPTSLKIPGRIYLVPKEHFGATQLFLTGSRKHWETLREKARERRYRLTKEGLFLKDIPLAQQEEGIYRALGLSWCPPELRETGEEFLFLEEKGEEALVEEEDVFYLLHNHTDWSDGHASLEEMVEKARSFAAKGISINDHSKSASYAGGLDEKRIEEQKRVIQELRKKFSPFEILTGVEVDILPDGRLDFSDEVLKELDVVIASVHSHFRQSKEAMTDRLLKAARHPQVHLLGHPTGRLLLRRPGYQVDLEQVLETLEKEGKAVELNAHPERMDVSWRFLRKFPRLLTAVNSDAHSPHHFVYLKAGILFARKGLVTKDRLVNRELPWR